MKQVRIPQSSIGRARHSRARFRPAYLPGIAAGAAGLALTYAAHINGRPIASAIVALFGVMAVGALLGVRAGVFAGVAAALTFNLVFTDPAWVLTYSTADDLVPMIALTLSAVGSGLLAGRLRDRAIAAETAGSRVAELLRFSEELQSAVTLSQVELIAQAFLGSGLRVQLFVGIEAALESPASSPWGKDAAEECWASRLPDLRSGSKIAYLLKSAERRLGVLVVEVGAEPSGEDIGLFLPLLSLAIQRWQLAEQLGKADLVRRSEQFKTNLLSSVSHDFRTPLAAISASAGSILELGSGLDEATRVDLLASIQEQCGRLDRFTRNLLNLVRIEAGLDVRTLPVVDALEVLGGTLARVRRLPGVHTIRRDFAVTSALVRADESLLEQVFLNVLENAVTHTPPGTSVLVAAETRDDLLVVAVEDDGHGIPADERQRVFERFHQVAHEGRPTSGSGLGLSIARGFTELFAGSISATTAAAPLCGARIEIRLPLTQDAR